MASVNVNRNVSDAFYRYKIRIRAKVDKGNGIKTFQQMLKFSNSIDIVVGPPPERTVGNKLTKKGYSIMTSKTILTLIGAIAWAIAIAAVSAIPIVTAASPYERQELSQTSEEIRTPIEKTTEQEDLIVTGDEENNFSNFKISNSYENIQDITTPSPETKKERMVSAGTWLGGVAEQEHLIVTDDEQNNFINFKISNSYEDIQDSTTPSPEREKRRMVSTETWLGGIAGQIVLAAIIFTICGGSCISNIIVGCLVISGIGLTVGHFTYM